MINRKVKVLAGILLFCASVQQFCDHGLYEKLLPFDISSKYGKENTTTPTQKVDCLEVRGTYGTWEQDLEYASRVQYIPTMGFRQKKHMRQQQRQGNNASFLPQTTQAWKETKFPTCAFEVMTRQAFCSVLQTLGIENVYMAGDSMMQSMYISLLGLLGFTQGVEYGQQVDCLGWDGFRLYFDRTLLYSIPPPLANSTTRIDKWGFDSITVVPNYGQVGISTCPSMPARERKNTPNYVANNGACPWIKDYESLLGRTLLIINTGAAYHARSTFQLMFDGLLDALDTTNVTRRNDIAYFRATSPAHFDCFNTTRYPPAPLSTFEEYVRLAETSQYSWNQFQFYNEYAKNRLRERRGQEGLFPLEYLNIFNMTALRQDGHVAASDCLHYELPAVVDWWNHLLYTNLLDIAAKEQGNVSKQS